jgi:hypothetical protein
MGFLGLLAEGFSTNRKLWGWSSPHSLSASEHLIDNGNSHLKVLSVL